MSSFYVLFKNDLRIILKDYKALLMIFLMPILVIQVFVMALSPLLENKSFVEPFKVVLVDKDKSPWTGLLGSQLKNVEIVESVIFADENDARKLVENQKAAAAIIIPQGLTTSINHLEPKEGKVIGSNLLYLQSRLVNNIASVGSMAVSAGVASVNVIYNTQAEMGFPQKKLQDEVNKSNIAFIDLVLNRKAVITEEKYKKPDVSPVAYYGLSLLAVFIMFSSIPCMKLLTEEKRLGILARLNAAPVRSWNTIASKLCISFLISVVQFSIITLFMIAATGNELKSSIGAMLPVFAATTLACGAFSLLIASISSTGSSADLIANLSILLMAILGGSLYPLSSLPPICRSLSVITINKWSAEGFLNALYSENPADKLTSCLGLIMLTVIFLVLSVLLLKARRRRMA